MDKNNNKQPVKFNWLYLFWVLCILVLLNGLLFPVVGGAGVESTDYGTFIQRVDSGLVSKVQIKDNDIFYTILRQGKEQQCETPEVNDPQLTERLLNAPGKNAAGKISFTQVPQQRNSPLMDFFLWWILPGILFYWLWSYASKRLVSGNGGGNFLQFGKSGAKVYAENSVKTTFADVAGQDEAKDQLMEIVDFLHHPGKYALMGARLPKGALLVGPPGTGKTLIARAVAGEAKVPFFAISGSEFVQMFVGMGAAKVRDLFNQAAAKAPCIIFIDEIDAIGKSRDAAMGNDEREQTLNQLLTEMDGFDATKGVVILAFWPPPTAPRASTRPCSVPAASTGEYRWNSPTSKAARLSSKFTCATSDTATSTLTSWAGPPRDRRAPTWPISSTRQH